MLRRLNACLIALLALSLASARVLNPASVTEQTLPNGLQVIVKHEPDWGLVAVGLHIRCGSVHDPEGKAGLAHLIEHLLFEAEGEMGLGLAVESLGGYINAETLRDFTSINLLVASTQFERALGLTAGRVTGMAIAPDVIAREKQVILREIADRAGDAAQQATDAVWETAFRKHPYRWSIGGTEATLKAITPEDVQAHYRRFYVPNNMALVVVGDVDPEVVFKLADQLFGSLPRREVDWREPASEPLPDEIRTEVRRSEGAATIVAMAFQAPGISEPRAVCALDLLYTLLGEGEEAWLSKTLVREKQLAFGATCDFLTQRYPGLFVISAVCAPQQEVNLRQALADRVRELGAGQVSQEELDRAKKLLYTSFAFTNETFVDQVGTIGFYAMIDSYRFAFDYLDICDSITLEELQTVAQRYLNPDRCSVVILRPRPQGQREASLPWPSG